MSGQLTTPELRIFDSGNNILWNAIIFAGMYSLKMVPDRALFHNWMLAMPFATNYSAYNANVLYPFVIAIGILRII